jgi:hypothetical protein
LRNQVIDIVEIHISAGGKDERSGALIQAPVDSCHPKHEFSVNQDDIDGAKQPLDEKPHGKEAQDDRGKVSRAHIQSL